MDLGALIPYIYPGFKPLVMDIFEFSQIITGGHKAVTAYLHRQGMLLQSAVTLLPSRLTTGPFLNHPRFTEENACMCRFFPFSDFYLFDDKNFDSKFTLFR